MFAKASPRTFAGDAANGSVFSIGIVLWLANRLVFGEIRHKFGVA